MGPVSALNKSKGALTFLSAVGVALLCTAEALAAHPTSGAHYSGTTSQKSRYVDGKFISNAISFDISKNGSKLEHPNFSLITHCSTGFHSWAGPSNHNTATASTKIKSSGKFTLRFGEKAKTNTGIAHAKFTVSGRFTTATSANGTASVVVHYSNGDSCRARHVHFVVIG